MIKTATLMCLAILLGFLMLLLFMYSLIAPEEMDETIPGVMALAICMGLLFAFSQISKVVAEDRRWLLWLMIVALWLRVVVCLAIFYGPINRDIFGEDQPGYDHMPRLLVHYWNGTGLRPDRLLGESNRLGYYFFVAGQYSVLGWSLLIPRMFNCLAGAMMVFYAYRIGTLVYGRDVARVVSTWVTFFPSLVLWSTLNLRDIWLALAILIIVYHALRLRERISPSSMVAIFLGLLWLNYNRFYLVGVMSLIVLAILLMGRSSRLLHNVVLLAVVLVGMVGLYVTMGVGERKIDYLDMQTVAFHRQKLGASSTGRSGYMTDVDVTNPVVLVSLIPLGVAYFLFSPFPWQVTGLRQILTLPEMVAWYLAIPFVVRAIRDTIRTRDGKQLGLLFALTTITLAYCIGSVNMGAAYRYRAQVIVFYLLFGAAGLINKKRRPRLAGGFARIDDKPVHAPRAEPARVPVREGGPTLEFPVRPPAERRGLS